MILVKLFLSFLKIGLFAIGGAYSFLPLIEKEVVEKYHWLTKEEFLDVLGVVKIFPGAISVKYATYTGYKIAGLPGAIVTNLANILGPALLITVAFGVYAKYKGIPSVKAAFAAIQLVVFSMILAVAFQVINVSQLLQFKSIFIVVVAFSLFIYGRIHPAIIIIGAGLIGALLR